MLYVLEVTQKSSDRETYVHRIMNQEIVLRPSMSESRAYEALLSQTQKYWFEGVKEFLCVLSIQRALPSFAPLFSSLSPEPIRCPILSS
jgi:hypothetical protein